MDDWSKLGALHAARSLTVRPSETGRPRPRFAKSPHPAPQEKVLRSNFFETVEDGRFRFHVEIGNRVTGLIVRYQGSATSLAAVSGNHTNFDQFGLPGFVLLWDDRALVIGNNSGRTMTNLFWLR